MKRHLTPLIAVAGILSLPFGLAHAATTTEAPNYLQLSYNLAHHTNLSAKAVQMAFAGYQWALKSGRVHNKDILTIVDYTVSSAKDRLYVINIKTGDILMALPVAHGKNSGKGAFATQFSDRTNSLESRVGVFLTQQPYYGHHGFSLRLTGLENSNKNVLANNVVVHSANYVTPEFIKEHGEAGHSWGCFAVDPHKSKQLINDIKDGTVLYAYGQSAQYMATTKILNSSTV